MDCSNCTKTAVVPFYEVESSREKNRSQTILLVVFFTLSMLCMLASLVFGYLVNRDCMAKVEAMNKYWLDYMSQYDFSDYTYDYTQDGKGLNIIGNNNGVDYNESTTGSSETDENAQRWESAGENDETAQPETLN